MYYFTRAKNVKSRLWGNLIKYRMIRPFDNILLCVCIDVLDLCIAHVRNAWFENIYNSRSLQSFDSNCSRCKSF